ncbi:DUF4040 domain-containing protein [Roseomonas sp. OT10]|uniref:hydrogenase subunit MbhD domain-containing protein n=1 Tax=Roseomonas cutis TaxID=2897332 RepID=UPI001E30BCA9|nr:hydrogenase subunit MbhD domain-containing protein [Roseomonas sp. OT10]UFN48576.1 DUF4040 domain-containing protein [Roseomonas sp. OT10]
MIALLPDAVLCAAILGLAACSVAVRQEGRAVLAFLSGGLLLALAWVRLGAVDVALTEAAVGTLSGVLLLRAAARLRGSPGTPAWPGRGQRLAAGLLCAAVALGLMAAVLSLPEPAPSLADAAAAGLPALGLGNPVTAVLIGYRALDTLLEKVVLLLSLAGVWSLTPDGFWGGRPWHRTGPAEPALGLLARLLPPLGLLLGVHLVWVSAEAPGGTFQGGTILAAMGLLAVMAGRAELPALADRRARWVLAAGPAAFFAVGLAGYGLADGFLAYPAWGAKPLILVVEFLLTPSLALLLALLLAGPAERPPEPRP